MTLLQQFIKERMATYTPAERKGTPKGDPIGFSTEKYESALLMLTGMKQREIAAKMGISHGLLRKWNTEEPFKEEVQRHHLEFSAYYIKHLSDKTRRGDDRASKAVARWDELKDSPHYSSALKEMLAQAITDAVGQAPQKDFLAFLGAALDALRLLGGKEDDKDIREYRVSLMQQSQRQILSEVRKTLEKPSLSAAERQHSIYLLSFLQKSQEKES